MSSLGCGRSLPGTQGNAALHVSRFEARCTKEITPPLQGKQGPGKDRAKSCSSWELHHDWPQSILNTAKVCVPVFSLYSALMMKDKGTDQMPLKTHKLQNDNCDHWSILYAAHTVYRCAQPSDISTWHYHLQMC